MSITLKIHEGTGKLTGQSLCKSCSKSLLFTDSMGEHTVCRATFGDDVVVRGKVVSCNAYYSRDLPSVEDMKDIAWILRTDKKGKTIGFAAPDPKKRSDED